MQYDEMVIAGIERACEKHPDKPALMYLGQKFSYAKFMELIHRFAAALFDLGVKDNDKVMLYIPNCPQFLIAYLEAQQMRPAPGCQAHSSGEFFLNLSKEAPCI